ncbi:MAG: hypothetical protein ACE366_09570 [Bradymonadia bacterium]
MTGCDDTSTPANGNDAETSDASAHLDAGATADALPPDLAFDAVAAPPMADGGDLPDSTSIDEGTSDAAPVDSALPSELDALVLDEGLDVDVLDMTPADEGLPDAGALDAELVDEGPPIELACADGEDNDDDGVADCADIDCRFNAFCFDARETCDNAVDDNADGWVDCDDVTCHDTPQCPAPNVEPFTTAEIQALFDEACAPCHFTEPPSAQLGFADFAEQTVGVPSSQTPLLRIKAGDRSGSYLFDKIRYSHLDALGGGGEGMPPFDRFNAEQVERIGRWIDALGTD